MNLFIDAHVLDGMPQGSRTYVKELYKELILQNPGINFFLGAINAERLREEFGSHPNVCFIRYWTKNRYLRMIVNIPWIILKNNIDLAHYQYICPLFKFSAEIVTIHDVLFLDFPHFFPFRFRILNRMLFRLSAKRADFLLTVSEYSKERIAFHLKIESQKIHVISNGVSNDFFISGNMLPDVKKKYGLRNYILYVSRIEPRKNHIALVKAFYELGLWKFDFDLLLLGTETFPVPELKDYLNYLPPDARNSIIIIGEAYGPELVSFYRHASLFVYPSLAEGFGIPPLEAFASGVPVICSATTSMKEFSFVGEGFFDPSSEGELMERISGMLAARKVVDQDTVEYIRQNYSWEKSAGVLSALIFNAEIK